MTYAMSLGAGDVGARVVLRRRMPEGGATDLVGLLEGWGDGLARIRTRAGTVDVPVSELLAGKRVPPAPVRRAPAGEP